MDEIEKYYTEHRAELDVRKSSANTWERLASQLDEQELRAQSHRKRVNFRPWLAAASIALLLGLGSFWLFSGEVSVGLEEDQYFPDLVLTTPAGDPVAISSLKGKVVLVEFWASWSTVCTEENCYYFEPIYEEYKAQGFEVYAVSLDSEHGDWVKGIERDQLPWIQVSDLEGLDSPLTRKFKIDELPATFLLDQEGKIVQRNVDANNLRQYLDVLLATN